MAEILDGDGHARADRRLHRRAADEGRDGRGARRPGARHARRGRARSPLDRARPALIDTCGTGGDRPHTHQRVDASPRSSSPAPVPRSCKHGNRAASSQLRLGRRARGARRASSTSAPTGVARCVDEAGIGLLLRAALPPGACASPGPTRRELGVPTMFNFLGPLANPARVAAPGRRRRRPGDGRAVIAGVLRGSWARRAPGRSSATTASTSSPPPRPSTVLEVRDGEVAQLRRRPADARAAARARRATSAAATPTHNAELARGGAGR